MRVRTLLPLAAFVALGSCREASAPHTTSVRAGVAGTFDLMPVVTTPLALYAGAGIRFALPLSVAHPGGSVAGPVNWTVHWNYGVDGKSSSGTTGANSSVPQVNHVYNTPGTYIARTTVTDVNGETASASTTITVVGGDQAPTASVAEFTTFDLGGDVVLDGSGSSDLNAFPLTYQWQFNGAGSSKAAILRPKNAPLGEHSWRLIVTNSIGLADTASGTLLVDHPAPTARLITPALKIDEESPFELRVDRLRGQAGDAITVEFDCNDGGYIHVATEGAFTCDGLGIPNEGTYEVGVRLTDAHSRQREYRALVYAKNKKPTITIDNLLDFGPGQWVVQYTANDVTADMPLTVMFFVNGVRHGGTQQVPPSFNSPMLNANWGDVITIRVRDKTGAHSERSVTLIEP